MNPCSLREKQYPWVHETLDPQGKKLPKRLNPNIGISAHFHGFSR